MMLRPLSSRVRSTRSTRDQDRASGRSFTSGCELGRSRLAHRGRVE